MKSQNWTTRIRIAWKSSFCSQNSQWWFRFLRKMLLWLRIVISIKKLPISEVESSLKLNHEINQTYKILLSQNHWIWNFDVTDLFDISIKDRRKLWSYAKFQKIKVWTKLGEAMTRNLFTQTISNWKEIESFGIYICVLLTPILRVLFLELKMGTKLSLRSNLTFF